MKKEIQYYKKDGKNYAVILYRDEKNGVVAECDTATFPYVYYYPHIQIYSRVNYIKHYEKMVPGCPCMTCKTIAELVP